MRLVVVAAALCARTALADDGNRELERAFIVGVGGAGEIELAGGAVHAGANLMFEWEAIDGWLEIEADASILASSGGYELPFDVLVKKPFRLSRRFECMIGLGPELVRAADGTLHYGGELALDLMYWPTRRAGVWIEPAYEVVSASGTTQSLGITAGAMVGW